MDIIVAIRWIVMHKPALDFLSLKVLILQACHRVIIVLEISQIFLKALTIQVVVTITSIININNNIMDMIITIHIRKAMGME